MSSNDEILILNVGGIRYETNRKTLTKYPDTFLGTIFGEIYKEHNQPTKENEYFFDRNGYAFRYVLEYHRTGQILWTCSDESENCNGVNIKEMISEFEFFQIPNNLKELEDKEYELSEIKDLFKELSMTTYPSLMSNNLNTESTPNAPEKFGATSSYLPNNLPNDLPNNLPNNLSNNPPNNLPNSGIADATSSRYPQYTNYPDNKVVRLRRWTTFEEHAKILDSFIIALSDVIYEIQHHLRRQITIFFHSRLPKLMGNRDSPSIEADLDLDSVKEIMKPFSASGYKLLELYESEIEEKLKRDFNGAIAVETKSPSSNTKTITILILVILDQSSISSILSQSSLNK